MRARVRFVADYECRNVSPGTIKRFGAGEEAVLVWWEPTESVTGRRTDGIWGTDYDIDEAWLVPQDKVEVLEVLGAVALRALRT